MATSNQTAAVKRISKANSPEDLFGKLSGKTRDDTLASIREAYRKLAKHVHPDASPGDKGEAFIKLKALQEQAELRVNAGAYGTAYPDMIRKVTPAAATPASPAHAPSITVDTKKCQYTTGEFIASGDVADLYKCKSSGLKHLVFKISSSPADNDLLEREATTLRKLYPQEQADEKFYRYLPTLVDSFIFKSSAGSLRRVNILPDLTEYYSFAEIIEAFPKGLDYRDSIWMYKRVLAALGFIHKQEYLHGAITPQHILVHPTAHGAKIVGWSYAESLAPVTFTAPDDGNPLGPLHPLGVRRLDPYSMRVVETMPASPRIRAISAPYRGMYAPEILAKQDASTSTDIYMATKCAIALLSGDASGAGKIPATVPFQLKGFLESCVVQNPKRRPDDAWKLHEELDELLVRVLGKPKYRPLTMPARR